MKFLKFIIALGLLPLLAAEGWILVDFIKSSLPSGEWSSSWFLSFVAGFLTWLMVFFFMPRTMWLYVLGHELTHALAAMAAGGQVIQFRVTSQGGHIATNRISWWIALSPYFVPLYALLWGALWLTVNVYYPLYHWLPILYFGLGLFWAFHLTFTVTMLHPDQTDLSGEGYFFSGVVILTINLLCVVLLFIPLARDLSWHEMGAMAQHHLVTSYQTTWLILLDIERTLVQEWQRLNYGGN